MKSRQKSMTPEELRKMQLIQVDLLVELDRVCRKHEIKYILDAGTLLGAVRYGKFIPWDDDIDVRMLRSEYEKFARVAPQELRSDIFFQSYKTDKGYPWLYSKLRKNGTIAVRVGQEHLQMHHGVFIDIFPCDGVPEHQLQKKMQTLLARVCRKCLYARTARYEAETMAGRLFWNMVSLVPKSLPHLCVSWLSKLFDDQKCTLVGSLGWHAPKDRDGFQKKWFTETCDIRFEGHNFKAPRDWDGFLQYSFGPDYMSPPPLEQRTVSGPLSSYDLGD